VCLGFAPGRGAAGQPPIFEPVSGQVGLRFLGKVISGCRDRTAITSVETECDNPETKSTGREGANTWVFGAAPGKSPPCGESNEDSNQGPARLSMRDLRGEIAPPELRLPTCDLAVRIGDV
jgi:hypothetical protein